MKKNVLEFLKRGLMAAVGGPIVIAIVYGILGMNGVIESLSPAEVSKGVISAALLAFIAAGITVVYTVEKLPLISAIMLHCGVLYLDYLLIYLINNWLQRSAIGIFTIIFLAGYAMIWLGIYAFTKANTDKLNKKLSKN